MVRSFSQRMGFKPVRTVFQKDFIEPNLRNSLWNILTKFYFNEFLLYIQDKSSPLLIAYPAIADLFERIWAYHLMEPIDEIDQKWYPNYIKIREYFFTCVWHEVYEFIEFVANNYYDASVNGDFMAACNFVLKRELSAYSFVGGVIIPITSDQEIAEIETALTVSQKFTQHLNQALKLLADKKAPDYRNSIKESISAVEAMCRLIVGDKKATLGKALTRLESKIGPYHNSLRNALNQLYEYSSDAEGIRHGLVGKSDLDIEDAKFMLISCSAFISYLAAKADKAGIQLSQE